MNIVKQNNLTSMHFMEKYQKNMLFSKFLPRKSIKTRLISVYSFLIFLSKIN